MSLWTDLIDPATLTGYARKSLEDYEAAKGTLARYLPNRTVEDTVVRFNVTQNGLVETAKFRAFDAEPEIGKGEGGKRVTIELPAIGQNIPITELDQLRNRNASDDLKVREILKTTRRVVRAVADAMEYQRGVALLTGIGTIAQDNFTAVDNFGRSGSHTVSAGTAWSDVTVDRLADLQAWVDTYEATNGELPGSIVMTKPVFRAFAKGNQFQTQLVNGGARRPTDAEVRAFVEGQDLPPIEIYTRKVNLSGTGTTSVLGADKLLLLPAPVDPDDAEGTDLGGTFWGRTLTSDDPDWDIEDTEGAGIVAGVWKNDKPPMISQVISDAIGLPVLANANLSFCADVL
ncbi:hypothetical protein GCM10022234_00200 [Aeromicrobium panaciterrae]|uniref:major capsid protein n=1 Tax=Aeromicrobium panaciterrae TaxID=363861 RepID=UPI0031D92E3C